MKISVCLALIRVLERARRRLAHLLWFLAIFVAITHLGLAIFLSLACRPLSMEWNPSIKGSCLSQHIVVSVAHAGYAIDVATDLICAVIPIIVFMRMQMSLQTKISLCVLMGVGVITAGIAIASWIAVQGAYSQDWLYKLSLAAILGQAEQCTGLILTSLPPLRSLISRRQESPERSLYWLKQIKKCYPASRRMGRKAEQVKDEKAPCSDNWAANNLKPYPELFSFGQYQGNQTNKTVSSPEIRE